MTPKIPDYCFTVSPIIKPESGIKRIEAYLSNELKACEHSWAEGAISRWDEDLKLLDHFYADHEEKPETYEIEINGLREQYEPFIHIEIINGGLYYMSLKDIS